jgi:hypothetical protein
MKGSEYKSILIEIEIEDKKQIMEKYKLVGTLENLIYEGYLLVDGKKKTQPLDSKKLKNIDWIKICNAYIAYIWSRDQTGIVS